jgi:hypothetical protein
VISGPIVTVPVYYLREVVVEDMQPEITRRMLSNCPEGSHCIQDFQRLRWISIWTMPSMLKLQLVWTIIAANIQSTCPYLIQYVLGLSILLGRTSGTVPATVLCLHFETVY